MTNGVPSPLTEVSANALMLVPYWCCPTVTPEYGCHCQYGVHSRKPPVLPEEMRPCK